jgi:putative ABC transport system ATP-binding protein
MTKAMEDEATPLVQIRNLTKAYRRGSVVVPVLHDISFDIAPFEFLALMGPSGSGKSTLLNLIAGLDRADGGTIRVDDIPITSLSELELAEWRATHVGFIFQFYNLIPVLSALENVELPLHLTTLSPRKRREHAETALRLVSLTHRLRHYPSQLSGGEQQRVAIARAVVTDPTILVADEPTGNLDTKASNDIISIFCQLNREGITIVLVTHEIDIAVQARRIVRLLDGQIVEDRQTGSKTCEPTEPARS